MMPARPTWLLLVPIALIGLLGRPAFGQTASTGALTGTVRDASGAVAPGAEVTLTHVDTGAARTTVTDAKGGYAVGFLAPGRYTLRFALTGFKTIQREGVTLNVTETVEVDAALEVSTQEQQVTVTAEGDLLQTRTSTLGRVVDSQQVTSLPLVTRNFTHLTALSPGSSASVPDALAVGSGSQNVFTNGNTQLSNSYTLDGVESTNTFSSTATTDFGIIGVATPSVETIQEFKVQTSLFDASYGRKAGASISLITKAGTSEFHGGAYEFFRNNVLNANDFFFNANGQRRPVLRQNQFGGTLGGPIRKRGTFFFLSYEGLRQINGASQSSTSTLRLPPIPVDRSAASLGRVFGGQAGTGGGVAVANEGSNIHPVALKLLNFKLADGSYFLPGPQTTGGTGANYAVSVPATYDQNQFAVSLTHQISSKNRFAGKYFFLTSERIAPFFQNNVPGFPSIVPGDNQNLALSDVHVIGPNSVNELRVGYTRFKGANVTSPALTDKDVGIFRSNQDEVKGLPRTAVQGAWQFGSPGTESQVTDNVFFLADVYSFSRDWKGRHDFRIGAETRRTQDNLNLPNQQQVGILQVRSIVDFLIGLPAGAIAQGGNGTANSSIFSSQIQSGIFFRGLRTFEQGVFLADDWKVHPRLTLNVGLRWEYLGGLSDNRGLISTFDARRYTTPAPGTVTANGFVQPSNTEFPVAGTPLVGDTLMDSEDFNNFAPRFGFAYRPSTRRSLVVRGGYGIYYDRPYGRPQTTSLGLGSAPFASRFVLSAAQNAAASWARPFPDLLPLSAFPVPFAIPGAGAGTPIAVQFLDRGIRTPYVQQFTLSLQQELASNLLLEAAYVGSTARRLQHARQWNQSLLASPQRPVNGITTNSAANTTGRVPFVGLTSLVGLQGTGTTNYHSLQASLTKRLRRGLSFLASYTYSKSLGTVGTGAADGSTADLFGSSAQDDTNIRGDGYGPSNFDRTHRVVWSYTYDLPGPRGTGLLARTAGGWRLAGIVVLQSGVPFGVTDSLGGSLYRTGGSRASFAAGASIDTARGDGSVHSRLGQYFNRQAFVPATVIAAGGTTPDGFPVSAVGAIFGNTGRNILRGPAQRNVDLAIVKRTALGERAALEFRSEFFNLFNNVNFGLPGTDVSTAGTFGVITSTSSAPRVLQFALKLTF